MRDLWYLKDLTIHDVQPTRAEYAERELGCPLKAGNERISEYGFVGFVPVTGECRRISIVAWDSYERSGFIIRM